MDCEMFYDKELQIQVLRVLWGGALDGQELRHTEHVWFGCKRFLSFYTGSTRSWYEFEKEDGTRFDVESLDDVAIIRYRFIGETKPSCDVPPGYKVVLYRADTNEEVDDDHDEHGWPILTVRKLVRIEAERPNLFQRFVMLLKWW